MTEQLRYKSDKGIKRQIPFSGRIAENISNIRENVTSVNINTAL